MIHFHLAGYDTLNLSYIAFNILIIAMFVISMAVVHMKPARGTASYAHDSQVQLCQPRLFDNAQADSF
jgi:hypothetical protein